jgi:hypothetical protein
MHASAPLQLFRLPTGELRFGGAEEASSQGREVASFVFSFVVFLAALWLMG